MKPDVRPGWCKLCGRPCDGDLCSAHRDLVDNPVDDEEPQETVEQGPGRARP